MARPRSVHAWLTAVLQLIMVVGLSVAIYERQWFNAFLVGIIICVTLLPAVVGRRFGVRIPSELELLAILFVFASLFLGEIRGYYARFWWWDVVLHTGSGLLLGIVGFLLVYVMNQHERIELHMKPGFVALFSFAFAVAVGAVWEIFEYAMDTLFGLNMQKSGLVDTMWDLIVDTAGALVIAILGYAYMKAGTQSFIEKWIDKFVDANPRLFRRHR